MRWLRHITGPACPTEQCAADEIGAGITGQRRDYAFCIACKAFCMVCAAFCMACVAFCIACATFCMACATFCMTCTTFCMTCTTFCVVSKYRHCKTNDATAGPHVTPQDKSLYCYMRGGNLGARLLNHSLTLRVEIDIRSCILHSLFEGNKGCCTL
mgnify:CR=1 FL=1